MNRQKISALLVEECELQVRTRQKSLALNAQKKKEGRKKLQQQVASIMRTEQLYTGDTKRMPNLGIGVL